MAGLALALPAAAFPQIYQVDASSVASPPPPIAFDPWTTVKEDEFQIEKQVTFPSSVRSPHPENDRIRVRVILPAGKKGPLPCVILLNYWGAADEQMEESLARRLNARGIAAVLMPLPYHLSRTPKGARSGQLAIQADVEALKLTMVQSVADVRRTVDLIQTLPVLDGKRIGVSGTSLGSIVGALAFALEPRLGSASFLLGGVDLAHIFWRSSVVVQQRERMRGQGWTEERLREALQPVEPKGFLEPLGERKALVVWARHDQVVPRQSSLDLIDKLGKPAVVALESGHYGGFLIQGEVLRTVSSFFDATFRGEDYTPPGRLTAPTLRVGMFYNPETSFQVGLGIDLWRAGSKWHATPIITPKGVQGFVGLQVGGQVSLGATLTGAKTTWGMAWTVIL
jgi:hypothetical protein